MMPYVKGVFCAVLALGGIVLGASLQDWPGTALHAAEEEEGSLRTDGYFSARYVARRAEVTLGTEERTDRDEDLFAQLRIDVTQPEPGRYEFHFFASAKGDLDGEQDRTGYYPLEGVNDTRQDPWVGYVYEAHFDFNYLTDSLRQLRLGRQAGTRDEPIFFDGAAADLEWSRSFGATVYGGYAVHFYELGSDPGDDTLGGLGIDYAPADATKITLDYLAVRDEREPFSSERKDSLTSVGLRQGLGRHWRAAIKARGINGEARDAELRTLGMSETGALSFSAVYFRQFRTQNELSTDLAPYSDVLGQSEPFHSLDVKLRWLFGGDYAVDVGLFRRQLLAETDEGPFNRDYRRYYSVLDVDNLWFERFSVSLVAERWDAGTREVSTGGCELAYRTAAADAARYSAGSYYSIYKYDYYVELGERTRVRTYYVKADVPLGGGYSVNGAYEYEDAGDRFQTLKVGTRYDF